MGGRIKFPFKAELSGKLILVGGLEHGFYEFPYIGKFIIPPNELIFFRGVGIPPTSISIGIDQTTTEKCKAHLKHRQKVLKFAVWSKGVSESVHPDRKVDEASKVGWTKHLDTSTWFHLCVFVDWPLVKHRISDENYWKRRTQVRHLWAGWEAMKQILYYYILLYFDIVILGELMSLGWLYGIYIYIVFTYHKITWPILLRHGRWASKKTPSFGLGKSWDFNLQNFPLKKPRLIPQ